MTPDLTRQQTIELVDLLKDSNEIADKYFVADLLYLYDNFDKELLASLIKTAVHHKDPSFNRIFIKPCINVFGFTFIANELASIYNNGDLIEKEGVKRLVYWISPEEANSSVDSLHRLVRG